MYETSSQSVTVQNRIFLREVESRRSVLAHFTSQKQTRVFSFREWRKAIPQPSGKPRTAQLMSNF